MTVKKAVELIRESKLDDSRTIIMEVLSQKAVEALDERKQTIAKKMFGPDKK
jgi:hypothetical protein